MLDVFAPYNFIPFSEVTVPKPFSTKAALPKHSHVEERALSGTITFEIEALGEITIGGEQGRDRRNKERFFCKDVSGRYVIPGSTLRGFLRSHAELLSFASTDYIHEEHYLYRRLAGNCKTARDDYSSELKAQEEGGLRLPDGVKAGWLRKEGSRFFFYPVLEFGKAGTTFFQVHERDLRRADVLSGSCYMYSEEIPKFRLEKIEGESDAQKEKRIKRELKDYNTKLKQVKNTYYRPYHGGYVSFDYKNGYLENIKGKNAAFRGIVLNSAWMDGKTHHYLVSAERSGTRFEIPSDQIADYQSDYERNCIQNAKLRDDFYRLPQRNNEEVLFFYKLDSMTHRLVGFGPTPYFRVFYRQSVRQGIPQKNQAAGFDYVQGLFGFVGKDTQGNVQAYKSRISVADAVYGGSQRPVRREALLSLPRGTAFQMYLEQRGRNRSNLNTYNTRGFRLRGYKFYWKRQKAKTAFDTSQIRNMDLLSKFETLPIGSVFTGTIRFENLREDELGLLLLALRYRSENERETFLIGGAKPYGYGKIQFRNIRLGLIDQTSRYTDFNLTEMPSTDRIAVLKDSFKSALKEKYGIQMEATETVKIYLAYSGNEDAEAYLRQHEGIYMAVGNKIHPSYTDGYPLQTAEEIFALLGSESTPSVTEETEREPVSPQSAVQEGAIWLAGYGLSIEQKAKIEEKGIHVLEERKEWPRQDLLEEYSSRYSTVLLPSRVDKALFDFSKRRFAHVYQAIKNGELDCDWRTVKV